MKRFIKNLEEGDRLCLVRRKKKETIRATYVVVAVVRGVLLLLQMIKRPGSTLFISREELSAQALPGSRRLKKR